MHPNTMSRFDWNIAMEKNSILTDQDCTYQSPLHAIIYSQFFKFSLWKFQNNFGKLLNDIVTFNTLLYTGNITTAKSAGFTCVPFSPVLSLSFWQSTNAGSESLYFNCTPKCFPNFTIFTCYFDIFVEKKITANYLSKIHSLMI